MALLQQLRGHGLELQATGQELLVGPRLALTDPLRETIRANKAVLLKELEDEAVDYQRGLRLLAELLSREAFIPEPSVESLRKYFSLLCGVLTEGLLPEDLADWRNRIAHSRGLVTHFGRSGVTPLSLLFAVRRWEHRQCGRAKKMPVPRAPWYQQALAEWERIRDASRATRVRRPKGKPKPPPPEPPPRRAQAVDSTAALWAPPPDPERTNQGLAAEPRYLLEQLQDEAYRTRYQESLGGPFEPDAPNESNRDDAAAEGAAGTVTSDDERGLSLLALQREPEYPPLPSWALQPATARA